jgi:hypothetical protein
MESGAETAVLQSEPLLGRRGNSFHSRSNQVTEELCRADQVGDDILVESRQRCAHARIIPFLTAQRKLVAIGLRIPIAQTKLMRLSLVAANDCVNLPGLVCAILCVNTSRRVNQSGFVGLAQSNAQTKMGLAQTKAIAR